MRGDSGDGRPRANGLRRRTSEGLVLADYTGRVCTAVPNEVMVLTDTMVPASLMVLTVAMAQTGMNDPTK
ncbi:hypothetical protein GCM10009813_03530 [Brevibacterium marinum]